MRRAPIASPTAAAALAPASSVSHPSTVKFSTSVICLSYFNILSDECFQNFVPGSNREADWVCVYPPRYCGKPRADSTHRRCPRGLRPDPCHADQFTRDSLRSSSKWWRLAFLRTNSKNATPAPPNQGRKAESVSALLVLRCRVFS